MLYSSTCLGDGGGWQHFRAKLKKNNPKLHAGRRFMMNIQACKTPKQHVVQCLVSAEQKRGGCSCWSDRQRDERRNLSDGVAAGFRRAVGAREDDEEIETDLSSPRISKWWFNTVIRLWDFSRWLHQAGERKKKSILLFSQIQLLLPLPPRDVPLLSYVKGSVPTTSVSKLIHLSCGFGWRTFGR